jgi:hypothetical protein
MRNFIAEPGVSAFIGDVLALLLRLAPEENRRLALVVGAGEFAVAEFLGDVDRRRIVGMDQAGRRL